MKLFYEWYSENEWKPCRKTDGYEILSIDAIDTREMDFYMTYRGDPDYIGLNKLCCQVYSKYRWYIDSMENDYHIIKNAADLIAFKSLIEARMLEDILDGQDR